MRYTQKSDHQKREIPVSENPAVEPFWQQYLDSLPLDRPRPSHYEAWYFCDTQECADELAALVQARIKTATCGSVWAYERQGEPIPQVGDLSVITTWTGEPVCVIETLEIVIRPYCEVDAQFAYDEGEGDRSLEYWRQAHWRFFTRELAPFGLSPTEDMPLVCERFRVVFPA